MKPHARIFICYRREGGSDMARLVRDNLRDRGFDVFMDVEDLKSGQFNEGLLREIESATDVLVILSPGSLDRSFQDGDWLRWELAHSIACKKNVVPVLMRGFVWPSQPLPEDLKALPYHQGVEPSHNFFSASIDKLVTLLKGHPTSQSYLRKQLPIAAASIAGIVIIIGWLALHRGDRALSVENSLPVSASHVSGNIDAVSDGKEPKSSMDISIPKFSWWDHRGTTEWVQYNFEKPRNISAVEVYWFSKRGIRVPKSWRLLYIEKRRWKEVEGVSDYGTKLDVYNRASFKRVRTESLKIEVILQKGFSGGILEWKIYE